MSSRNFKRSNKGFPNNTKPQTTWNDCLIPRLDLTPMLLKLIYDIKIEGMLPNESGKPNIFHL